MEISEYTPAKWKWDNPNKQTKNQQIKQGILFFCVFIFFLQQVFKGAERVKFKTSL